MSLPSVPSPQRSSLDGQVLVEETEDEDPDASGDISQLDPVSFSFRRYMYPLVMTNIAMEAMAHL